MSEVLLCCPLPGPPPEYSGDCGSCKTYTWSTNEIGELYFFLPYQDKRLVGFDFSANTNNGSNILVELYYCRNGVCQVWETWNLGQLTTPEKNYAIIDFGANPVYNSFELRITTSNGTSGSLDVCLDCEIPVMIVPFCTGFTYNEETCDCTGATVTLYAEEIKELPKEFPFNLSGYTWYTDPELQNPAPCGDYMYDEKIVFTYNCNDSSSTITHICGCATEVCSAATKNDIFTHTLFTKPNPYLPNVTNPPNHGNYFYSEHCLNLALTNQTPTAGFIKMTFEYTGTPDTVEVTISDPMAPTPNPGVISYSITEPPTSMLTRFDTITTIKVPSGGKTVWVTWPTSRSFKIRVMAGYKINNSNRSPVTTKITWYDCGTPLNAYVVGLHTYSAWDSIVDPKLTTVLYAYTGTPYTWVANSTVVYADRTLTQPAFPYFYGFSGDGTNQVVIKVGDYYRREFGTKKYYVASQLRFQNKFEQVIEPYKRHDRFDENNEYRVENCIDPLMDVGLITKIAPLSSVLRPSGYYYLMGRTTSTEGLANDDYFFRTDFLTVNSKKGEKIPLTGYEHATWKNIEAIIVGVKKYMNTWPEGQQVADALKTRNKRWGRFVSWGASILTLAIGVASFMIDPVGTITTLAGFAVQKVVQNNPQIFGNVTKYGNAIGYGLGSFFKNLFPVKEFARDNAGKMALMNKSVQRNLARTGKLGGSPGRPLQKLWHNIFHRGREGNFMGVGSSCVYDNCPPIEAKPNKGATAITMAFSLALQGLDRLYTKGYTRTYKEQCAEFYGRFTTTPYIDANPTQFLYRFSGLTGTENATYSDGGYIYKNTTTSPNSVQTKITSYKTIVKKGFLKKRNTTRIETPLPDEPRFVTDFGKMIFLPYVSGRPYKYSGSSCNSIDCGPNFTGGLYGNTQIEINYSTPPYMLGELNNPLPIEFTIPENYFFSDVSQEDANNMATSYLSSLTAATYNSDTSGENKPGTTDEVLNFSHRLEIMTEPNSDVFCYLDENNLGITVGTKLYYDWDGVFHCLPGYYSTIDPEESFFKKFYQVNSGGTVDDIWVMQNSTDTYATSQVTSQTASTVSQFSAYTSAWCIYADDILDTLFDKYYDNHNYFQTWGTEEFYNSPYICRGFMDNVGDNLFYIYNNNLEPNEGYSIAPYKFYRAINTTNTFNYVGELLIIIDMVEVCYPSGTTSGDTGIMFTLRDASGNTVPSIYGLTFDAQIYYNSTGNTIHQITFAEDETEYFLSLDPIYQGNITGVTITDYVSPQWYNTILFTGGTFTPCGDCVIGGEAVVPEGILSVSAGYGLQIDNISVIGDFPTFAYPITGITGTTMVGSYDIGTQFQVTLTGTRTGGTNKIIRLYSNNSYEDCQVISADPSGTVFTLDTSSYINVSDNLSIVIENSTSC
jgi:hypothetical protein